MIKMFRRGMVGVLLTALGLFSLTGCGSKYPVLDPVGPVGKEELHLIILSTILVAIIIIPVLILFFFILIRYRDKEGNKADYKPTWDDNKWLEIVWWGIPIVIIAILGVATAKTTLNLTKPPVKNVTPITIQVTSMDYKWLFTYPSEGIATINYVDIPAGVPINFELTSDAPMNSFWIPQLGGQEYTMPGMDMSLWLQSDKPGTYDGSGANFSGKDFANMKFKVITKKQSDFDTWVNQVKATNHPMTMNMYNQLVKPSVMNQTSYSSYPKNLFQTIVGKYSPKGTSNMSNMSNMKNMK